MSSAACRKTVRVLPVNRRDPPAADRLRAPIRCLHSAAFALFVEVLMSQPARPCRPSAWLVERRLVPLTPFEQQMVTSSDVPGNGHKLPLRKWWRVVKLRGIVPLIGLTVGSDIRMTRQAMAADDAKRRVNRLRPTKRYGW